MRHKPILLDLETQRDFFDPAGTCYSPKASKVAKKIYDLFDWAKRNRVPVISTLLRVRPGDIGPLADKPHCVDGSDGEKKLTRTILPSRIDLGLRNTTDLPPNLLDGHQQVIFEKRDTNIFHHARLERLITELPTAAFVICGAGVCNGIVESVVGLRSRGFDIIVASDAILDLKPEISEMAMLRMEAKGAVFAPTSEIIAPRPQQSTRPFRRSGSKGSGRTEKALSG